MSEDFFSCRTLRNIDDVFSTFLKYESHWIFRGQSRATWELETTLERLIKPWDRELAEKSEGRSLRVFQKRVHHYLDHDVLPESKLGWLALMQHHGVPTRLLDFTESPFIALFFAFDGVEINQSDDPAVWAVDYRRLMKNSVEYIKDRNKEFKIEYQEVSQKSDEIFQDIVDKHSYDVLWSTEPGKMNLRLERQSGSFILSGNPRKRIAELFAEMPKEQPNTLIHKIIIPAQIKRDVYKALKKMGLDNARLYSGIDGLAKDIKSEIQHHISDRATEQQLDVQDSVITV